MTSATINKIKASELRVGNLVTNTKLTEPVSINWGHLYVLSFHPEDHNLQPITLTDEWLVKFGINIFDLNGRKGIRHKFGGIQLVGLLSESAYDVQDALGISHSKIKYVHQLQNLYFALTGEELKSPN